MSAYGTLHSVPSFFKGGAGVVCIIHQTHVIYLFYDKGCAKAVYSPAGKIFTRFHFPCMNFFPYIKLTLACIKHLLNSH